MLAGCVACPFSSLSTIPAAGLHQGCYPFMRGDVGGALEIISRAFSWCSCACFWVKHPGGAMPGYHFLKANTQVSTESPELPAPAPAGLIGEGIVSLRLGH